ncbi:MAG: PhoH family protein [Flavobacteriales bacterium]|nr:PhoH family protein [Flavobacteriales bacterium]
MQEKEFTITGIDPVSILGVNNSKLRLIRKHFPTLKIISRGDTIKVIGEPKEVKRFTQRFEELRKHVERYNTLTDSDIANVVGEGNGDSSGKEDASILVYGNKGLRIKPRTKGHHRMVKAAEKNDLVLVSGPAGTGKTYTAVALAVRALKDKEVRRIILTRPAVEAGESLGFLPGDMRDKLDPYMQPIYDSLFDMIPPKRLTEYLENRVIEIAPLAYMRGRTLDHAYVILDEAQNTTENQMKMFLTRMGMDAKFIITGDLTQVDLPHKKASGMVMAMNRLKKIDGIGIVELDSSDVIRHRLVKKIIDAFDKN